MADQHNAIATTKDTDEYIQSHSVLKQLQETESHVDVYINAISIQCARSYFGIARYGV